MQMLPYFILKCCVGLGNSHVLWWVIIVYKMYIIISLINASFLPDIGKVFLQGDENMWNQLS